MPIKMRSSTVILSTTGRSSVCAMADIRCWCSSVWMAPLFYVCSHSFDIHPWCYTMKVTCWFKSLMAVEEACQIIPRSEIKKGEELFLEIQHTFFHLRFITFRWTMTMTMTSDAPTLVPENALTTDPKCLWTPSHPENTHMEKFRQLMQSKHQDEKLGMNPPPPHAESNQSTSQLIIFCIDDYNALWKWSVEYPELFWSEVWDYTNIVSSVKGGHVIDKAEHMDAIPEWFKESRLNFAENLLWCRRSDKTAIVATGKRASRNGRDGC